jgi:cell division protease FtsH
MGGRAAEMLVFNNSTTGAANDIQRATEIARKMVCEWGMSEKIGPLRFGLGHEEVFLGRDLVQLKEYSEKTASLIDQEVQSLVRSAYEKALSIIKTHRPVLEEIVQLLLERETITGEEIDAILNRHGFTPARIPSSPPSTIELSSG